MSSRKVTATSSWTKVAADYEFLDGDSNEFLEGDSYGLGDSYYDESLGYSSELQIRGRRQLSVP